MKQPKKPNANNFFPAYEELFQVTSAEAGLTPEDVYPTPLHVDDTPSSPEWKCKSCPDKPDMVLMEPKEARIYQCPKCGWLDM